MRCVGGSGEGKTQVANWRPGRKFVNGFASKKHGGSSQFVMLRFTRGWSTRITHKLLTKSLQRSLIWWLFTLPHLLTSVEDKSSKEFLGDFTGISKVPWTHHEMSISNFNHIEGLCKRTSPQIMGNNMVLTYLHFRIQVRSPIDISWVYGPWVLRHHVGP